MKKEFNELVEITYPISNLTRTGSVEHTGILLTSFEDWVNTNGLECRVKRNSVGYKQVDYQAIKYLSIALSGYIPSKRCVLMDGSYIEVEEYRTSDLKEFRESLILSNDVYFMYSCEYIHIVDYTNGPKITSEWVINLGKLYVY